MSVAMQEHDELLQSVVGEAGGVVFKHTGDGVIAAFSSPKAAVDAALVAQGRLGLPVRMGLHTGEAELRNGDYFGTTLNRAARVMDAGHGGQVLVSPSTAVLLDDAIETVDLGLFELKGLEGAERVLQVGDGSFPELRARRAETGNIPRALTEFVGRHDDLKHVQEELALAQIVTLFGVGGTGKTRLAVETARAAKGSFADGCWLVELGSVSSPAAVPVAVSTAVRMRAPESGDVTEALVRRLTERQMLIVVDNCEHLVDAAADVIEKIAAACPRVRLLATSREPLTIRGERVVPVGPLPDADGLALFLDRARAEAPGLVLDDRQLDAASALCRRLDGLPLAIELAAARVRSMTPVDLVAGLDERFRLLVGNRRSRTERQQTMRATLDWSYSLCDPVEQTVFDRLSVFPADFDITAATAVAGEELPSFAVPDALGRLVDRSLMTRDVGDDGTARFRMLETMRAYGRERLRDTGQADPVRERHARHLADEVDRLTATMLGPDENTAMRRGDQLHADIVLAVDWFVEHDQLEQAMRLPPALFGTRFGEALSMFELIRNVAIRIDASDELLAELDLHLPWVSGRLTPDEVVARLRLLRPRADRDVLAAGVAAGFKLSDDVAAEIRRYAQRFASARPYTRHVALGLSARSLIWSGRASEALELLEELDTLAESTQSELARTALLYLYAQIATRDGDWARAAHLLDELVRRRSGTLEMNIQSTVIRFGAISARTLAGDTVPVTEVRNAWDTLQRFDHAGAYWSAAAASAVWLASQDHRDLGIRFLRWAARLEFYNPLVFTANELAPFDLPTNPDGPDEALEPLIDQLDFV